MSEHQRQQTPNDADLPPRHAEVRADTAKRVEALDRNGARFLAHVGEAPSLLVKVARNAYSRAGHLLLIDPPAARDETRRALLLMAQAGTASYRLAARYAAGSGPGEETVPVRLDNDEEPSHVELLPKSAVDMGHSVADWQNTLWAAVICREKQLVDELVRVPEEAVRGRHRGFDPYMYAWADAIRAFFRGDPGDPDLYAKINRSIELTEPEGLRNATAEIALRRHFPQMKLLFDLAAGREDRFDEGLREAVRHHHAFWTSKGGPDEITHDRSAHAEGFFALAPTALAALAHDRGMPVGVTSDYLPARLVRLGAA